MGVDDSFELPPYQVYRSLKLNDRHNSSIANMVVAQEEGGAVEDRF